MSSSPQLIFRVAGTRRTCKNTRSRQGERHAKVGKVGSVRQLPTLRGLGDQRVMSLTVGTSSHGRKREEGEREREKVAKHFHRNKLGLRTHIKNLAAQTLQVHPICITRNGYSSRPFFFCAGSYLRFGRRLGGFDTCDCLSDENSARKTRASQRGFKIESGCIASVVTSRSACGEQRACFFPIFYSLR